MKGKMSKEIAKKTVKLLDAYLRADANSASCCIVYQPKAPKELAKYRKKR